MAYADLVDIEFLWRPMTEAEAIRANCLLPVVSALLANEARKVGKDLDEMIARSPGYGEVVKAVTVDVVTRTLRQNTTGEPMSQFNETALGYNQQGTYAIPGGGMANAIMNNDLKRLGLRRQRMGVIELYDNGNYDSACREDTDGS